MLKSCLAFRQSAAVPRPAIGEVTLPGLKQAVADINATGGIHGVPLRLEIMDDACEPKQAVAVAHKLAARQPVAIIGLSCSGSTLAAAAVYEDEGLPFIAALASNPELSRQGYHTLVRPASRDDQDAAAAVQWLTAKYPNKVIALVDDKEAWGKGIADLVAAGLVSHGFAAPLRYQLNPGEQDFSALATRIKNDKPDIIYVGALMRETGLFVRQLDQTGFHPLLVGSINMYMPDALAVMGPSSEKIVFTRVALPAAAVALARKLNPANENASIYNVQSYAAGQVLAQAIARVGVNPTALLADIHRSEFNTVLGDLTFNAGGDIADLPFEVRQWRGGTGR